VFARQPCYPIPRARNVGQWLCVPLFRAVCPYQAFRKSVRVTPYKFLLLWHPSEYIQCTYTRLLSAAIWNTNRLLIPSMLEK
jgi:hypothetical protein